MYEVCWSEDNKSSRTNHNIKESIVDAVRRLPQCWECTEAKVYARKIDAALERSHQCTCSTSFNHAQETVVSSLKDDYMSGNRYAETHEGDNLFHND